jgi:histidyl-tRNA synthetase
MASLKPVRGTHDVLPEESLRFRHVEETAYRLAQRYGYGEISTPIFEFTDVFSRTLGESSDIVTKEMYTFEDRGGESLTLRPEGTAGVARALISNGLAQELPLKLFYRGSMFRYERPQKGRLREFHQVGVELLGVADPIGDVEIVSLAWDFLDALGLDGTVTLELNSLGDGASRAAYRDTLVAYLEAHRARLSDDSLKRLEHNPLRILDSKDDGDREVVAGAPLLSDSFNAVSADYFETLKSGLDALGVVYTVNPRLVRGLDYYCHTAFEFTTGALGAQGTVLAGGRYDGLISQMGGPQVAGTGWAAGVERLSLLVAGAVAAPRSIAVVPIGATAEREALKLAHRLRRNGFMIDLGYSGNLGKRMKRANKINARAAVILGEDELARAVAIVRDMDSGDQAEAPLESLEDHLARYR